MIGKTISHYRILEKLGQGGMGVVYKAEDTKLKRTIALKFLPEEALSSDQARARFQYEAQAAAALDHPNICTVYEIDESEGQTFIAMALVSGQSLRDRIPLGPLKIEDVLDIAIQTADGLHEAHDKGVVHRDIKPSNVMVSENGQVKVMDFGLARSAEQTKITKAGSAPGTVAYMSPEQARGGEIDHRTDIWSFGVMLYEMVTGLLPFRGENDQSVIYSILNNDPEPMTALRTGVPMELERITAKAMSKRTEERYQDTTDLLVDLRALRRHLVGSTETISVDVSRLARPEAAKHRARRRALIIAAAGIVVIAGILFMRFRRQGLDLDPNRVVVGAFENRTGDPSLDAVGQMAADWITQGLSQTDVVKVVPTMAALHSSQAGAQEGGLRSMARLRALAEATGAGIVVSGTYYLEGEDLLFQTRVTDAEQGQLMYALPPTRGSPEAPMKSIEELRQQVMGALVSRFGDFHLSTEREQPPTYEAYREHMLGVSKFGSDYAEAIRHFERSAELDTTFLAPRLFMVYSYSNQARYAEADSLLTTLKRDRQRLTDYQRLYVDFLEALLRHNDAECLRFLRQLERTTPNAGNVNYLIGLTAIRLNRPREALETYAQYEVTEEYARYSFGWWKFGYWADAHHMLEEFPEELRVARHARELYPDVEWLRTDELRALVGLGRIAEAIRVVDECMALSDEVAFRCRVFALASLELRAHGHADAVPMIGTRADALCEDLLYDETASETDRHCVADMLCTLQRWKEARALYEDLATENPDNVDYLGNLGCLAARRADREEALAISQELERIRRPYLFGENTYWRACIAALLGDRERAVELLREALAQGQRYGVWLHRDLDLEGLHDYPPFQELLRPKG